MEKPDDINETKHLHLVTCAYLRDIVNKGNDYECLIQLMVSYGKQGFASIIISWHGDKDYRLKQSEMKFGDIRYSMPFDVKDINGKFKRCGSIQGWYDYCEIAIDIPLDICKYLHNAVLFYSQVLQCNKLQFNLCIKNTDQWIIDHFGGALHAKYTFVQVRFNESGFQSVHIQHEDKEEHPMRILDPIRNNISYKDINRHCEYKSDGDRLAKFRKELDLI